MAHFALINKENKVTQVIVVGNDKLLDDNIEVEQKGIDWLINDFKILELYSDCDTIKQTSYSSSFRNKYAGIGDEWDEENNLFREAKPFESWLLSKDRATYIAPKPIPDENKKYQWDEEKLNWIELENQNL